MATSNSTRWAWLGAVLAMGLAACSPDDAGGPTPKSDAVAATDTTAAADASTGADATAASDATAAADASTAADAAADATAMAADPMPIPYRDPLAKGPYPVGIATAVLPKGDTANDVPIEVWYPAAEVSATTTNYEFFGVPIPSGGYRGVAPQPKAHRLLVAFSHGMGGVRQQNYSMAERLASHGYIVVAPDHPGTTLVDIGNKGNLAKYLIHRPGTVIAAADAVRGGIVPGVVPSGETYAVIGHSLGAVTSLVLGGAVISPDNYTAACAKPKPDSGCGIIGPLTDLTPSDFAQIASPDKRIATLILQSPAGTYAFAADTLQKLPPTLIMGGDKDASYQSGAVAAFTAAGAATAFVTYLKGGHNGPTDICNIAVAKNFSPDCKVENGFADPNMVREASIAHVVAWLGLQIGKQTSYQAHLTSGQGFVWQSK